VAAFSDNLEDLTVYPQLWDGRDPEPIRGGCLPLEVQFTDLSQSPTPIVSYAWDFGDGTLLSGPYPNPAHTYTAEGIYSVSLSITTADGCVRSVSCDSCIRAGNPPLALLDTTGYPTLSCCDPATLFVDQTQGAYDYVWYAVTTGDWHGIVMDDTTSGNWDFGTTVPVFLDSGQYVSTMFYAYNLGCVDSFHLENWTMLQPPWGAAGIDLLPCQSNWPLGGTVVFDTTNTTYVPNVSYIDSVLWEFGDPAGSTSNELYPTFTYPDTGTYWITVTVWNFDNGCSCRVSGEQRLQIVVLPDTTFTLAPLSGCAPLSFQAQGPSQNVAAWSWSIGPGLASASGQSPSFTLDSLGTFDLSLVVSGADGCSDTIQREDIISVSGVKARIGADRLSGCAPFSVSLSDLSQASAPIVGRTWSLGDGTVISGNNASVSYTYAQAPLPPAQQAQGIPVILSLTDSAGCQDQDTIYLRIYAPLPAWASDTLHTCAGDTLIFKGLQDSTAGVGPLSYQWHAPGLSPDTLAGGEVRFFVPPGAPQPVYVSVQDAAGCHAGRWDTVSAVQKLPQAQFSAFPVQATCPPLLVSFTDLSQPGHAPIVQWSWDFGNGSFSSLQHPAKVYPAQGSYGVSLSITDSLGCSDSFTIPDLIRLTGVNGSFSVADDTICALDSVLFIASSPNAGSYTWDFGDGRLGLGPQFMHTYDSPGELYPALVMKDSSGSCSLTLTDTLRIFPLPSTPLPADTAFCEGGAATYDFFQPGAAYRWSTGDTASALTLRETGQYSVEIFYPETGCRTEASIALRVWPLPQVSLGSERVICEGDTIRISAQSPDTLQSYQWNVPSVLPASETERYVAFRQAGEVSLLVSDLRGCRSSDTVAVQVVPLPLIDLDHTPVCKGDTLWLDASPRNFQLPGIEYLWFQNEVPLAASGPRAGLTEPGPVEVWVQIQQCITPATAEVSFYPLPRSNQYRELLNCVYTGRSVTLDAGGYDAWLWEHSGERSQRVQVVEDTTYYFQVFNAFGCSARDSMAVVDACPPKLFVPTGFTPNEDGTNDLMTWGGDYLDQFEIQIFSRWGMRLFSTRDLSGRWDATYEGQPVPEGVYTWHAVYNGTHPNYRYMQTQVGTVTVLR
jgi:gliding motility-associated-like protein